MSDSTETERLVLAKAYAEPSLTAEEIADDLGVTASTVAEVLDDHDQDAVVDAARETDWDDPERCPFCGAAIPDGGPGFVDHTAESEPCRVAFEAWRENVAGDVGGEWSG